MSLCFVINQKNFLWINHEHWFFVMITVLLNLRISLSVNKFSGIKKLRFLFHKQMVLLKSFLFLCVLHRPQLHYELIIDLIWILNLLQFLIPLLLLAMLAVELVDGDWSSTCLENGNYSKMETFFRLENILHLSVQNCCSQEKVFANYFHLRFVPQPDFKKS